ncbi:leucine-rich repeat extensin-like protein 6 [Silene latifolia]|uniref:leucine-rich repeat extensin-like protein 6 n=1 Tax=Silene latifolia TaxID=37657 RepID=UPI003D779098
MNTNTKSISLPLYTTFYFLLFFTIPTHQATNDNNYNNPRLQKAYTFFQSWKKLITSDPNNFTSNWTGDNVCDYNGVYCAPVPNDPTCTTVAGIDLNHANIAGTIPDEIGYLLPDLALIHLNSNRFSGPIPGSFCHLQVLHELDLSNNLFCGVFPSVLLKLQNLKFLDIRYNHFDGSIPPALFELKLDALFLNNNNFNSYSPGSFGKSPVSVLVLANNNLNGCFPSEITKMGENLEEIILLNSGLKGCLPQNIGQLSKATVLDVSFNDITGKLPESIGNMKKLEQLDVAYNKLYGEVPSSICSLPNLQNFTYSHNYFCSEAPKCMELKVNDDKFNCVANRPLQRSPMECKAFLSYPPDCNSFGCTVTSPSPPPPSPPPPPPPHVPEYTPYPPVYSP